ncbi:hypothetical protein DRN98_08835 [Methanosarcinales archaeon]|nr:MAG: hypothetical protein DRN98_08835 [Methanosarcinales archaeon]
MNKNMIRNTSKKRRIRKKIIAGMVGKRGVGMAPETLGRMLLLSLTLFVIVGLILLFKSGFSFQKMESFMCFVSNGLKSETVPSIVPSACYYKPIDEPLDMSDFAEILTSLWWSHGRGKWSFGAIGDEPMLRYSVHFKEETNVSAIMKYLMTHKGKKKVSIDDSDYNYIQKGSEGETLCFDEVILYNDGTKLFPERPYYIYFLDDQEFFGEAVEDKIVVMTSTDVLGKFKCVSPTGDVSREGSLISGVEFKNQGMFK